MPATQERSRFEVSVVFRTLMNVSLNPTRGFCRSVEQQMAQECDYRPLSDVSEGVQAI